jgi:N6-L-threonylcarbamoyladenine synthase
VARLLGLSYPGGPSIQKAAETGNPEAFHFPRARLDGTWDFSFSGLKTAVLRTVRKFEEEGKPLPVEDMAASFQAAVTDVLVSKTLKAAVAFNAKEILVAGAFLPINRCAKLS